MALDWPARDDRFRPDAWREAYPYWPFSEADAADAYWAAKIVMRFDRALVDALVSTGRLSDRRAAAFLSDAIMIRREKIGRAYLEAVTPLDDLQVENGRICATDLGTRFGLTGGGVVELIDERGEVDDTAAVPSSARFCLPKPLGHGYVVLRLRVRRPSGELRRPMQVHVQDASRVLGVLRIEP